MKNEKWIQHRTFDGKKYRFWNAYSSKYEAEEFALQLKETGTIESYRVIPESYPNTLTSFSLFVYP